MEAINQPTSHFTTHFCEVMVQHYSNLLTTPDLPLHRRSFYKLQLRYYTTLQTRLSSVNEMASLLFFIP